MNAAKTAAALLLLPLLSAPSRAWSFGRAAVAARWTPAPVPLDGDYDRWTAAERDGFEGGGLSIAALNDGTTVELALTASGEDPQDQLTGQARQDLTLWFFGSDGKTRAWGVRLPFGRRRPDPDALRDPKTWAAANPEPELLRWTGVDGSTEAWPSDLASRLTISGRRPLWVLRLPLSRLARGKDGSVPFDFAATGASFRSRRREGGRPRRMEGAPLEPLKEAEVEPFLLRLRLRLALDPALER